MPRRGGVGEEDPSRQVKGVQCPRWVEGSRQLGEIRRGEFLSPPEQVHGDKEILMGKKRTPQFQHGDRIRHVAMTATEKTRTAKPARRWKAMGRRRAVRACSVAHAHLVELVVWGLVFGALVGGLVGRRSPAAPAELQVPKAA